jgi:hypothetical protein
MLFGAAGFNPVAKLMDVQFNVSSKAYSVAEKYFKVV